MKRLSKLFSVLLALLMALTAAMSALSVKAEENEYEEENTDLAYLNEILNVEYGAGSDGGRILAETSDEAAELPAESSGTAELNVDKEMPVYTAGGPIEEIAFNTARSYQLDKNQGTFALRNYFYVYPEGAERDLIITSSDETVLKYTGDTTNYTMEILDIGQSKITVASAANPEIKDTATFVVLDSPKEIYGLNGTDLTLYKDYYYWNYLGVIYNPLYSHLETEWSSSNTDLLKFSGGLSPYPSYTFIADKDATVVATAKSKFNSSLTLDFNINLKSSGDPEPGTYTSNVYINEADVMPTKENMVEVTNDSYQMELGKKYNILVENTGSYVIPDVEKVMAVTEDSTIVTNGEWVAGIPVGVEFDVVQGNYVYTVEATAEGTETFSLGDISFQLIVQDGPVTSDIFRMSGAGRFQTSMKIADAYKDEKGIEKFDNVILSSGLNFADALAGSYLSYKKKAPILITAADFGGPVYEEVNAYINANLKEGGTVYVLGGEGAVPETVLTGLEGYEIKRLSGRGRFETNIEILKEAGVKDEEILVATGFNFADSLSASAVNRPILLVDQELSLDQKAYLDTLETKQFYILGGTGAVKETVEEQLNEIGNVERIKGKGRHETSVAIAEKFCNSADRAVLAYSGNFPDGLCAGPLASVMDSPLILTTKAEADYAPAKAFCSERNITSGYVCGGTTLIDDKAARRIFSVSANIPVEKK